jgi:hypothetical protein
VYGVSTTCGTVRCAGGYFQSNGGGTGAQYGVYVAADHGTAGYFSNDGNSTATIQLGVYAENSGSGAGANAGAAIAGQGHAYSAGGAFAGAGATLATFQADAIDASGVNYAMYAPNPNGDSHYTLYGLAHIHGTNIAAGEYEQEAVYDGDAPLPLGRVVALDPANVTDGPLGVVPAGPDNADVAIGVVSYRLVMNQDQGAVVQPGGAAQLTTVSRPTIDAAATAVQPGDHVYITFAGRTKMHLNTPTPVKVGTRLTVGPDGTAVAASTDGLDVTFGKVASRPAADGTVDVIVSFK